MSYSNKNVIPNAFSISDGSISYITDKRNEGQFNVIQSHNLPPLKMEYVLSENLRKAVLIAHGFLYCMKRICKDMTGNRKPG